MPGQKIPKVPPQWKEIAPKGRVSIHSFTIIS